MPTIADAYVQIVPSADGIGEKLRTELGGEAEKAGTSAGNSLVEKVKGIIVAAGIGKVLKDSLMAGANLEQSIGGVETLFKDSSDKVIQYANDAFRTAGVSANDYMEQVTSFSASLLQSLGGDTAAAAESANQAIIDMADNSNKMGTSLESIQNAYQGFAKSNYTMLDNLKLGYGGTKTEMERLLADAQELSGVEYNIDNLDDVYEAIHVIQEDLGITGTTALEASETFTGSFGQMKAAAENLMGQLAIGGDVSGALSDLGSSVETFVTGNFLPMLETVLTGITELLPNIVSMIAEMAPTFIEAAVGLITTLIESIAENAALFAEAGITLFTALVTNLPQAIVSIVNALPTLIQGIVTGLVANIPTLIMAGVDLFCALITNLPTIIETIITAIPEIITGIVTGFADHWEEIKEAGKTLLSKLWDGITSWATTLYRNVKDTAAKLPDKIKEGIGSLTDTASNWIQGFIDGISNAAGAVYQKIKDVCSGALDTIKNFFGIKSPSRVMRDEVGKMLDMGMALGITANADDVYDAMHALQNGTLAACLSTNGSISSGASGTLDNIAATLDGIAAGGGDIIIKLNNRVLGRVLRENGVQFA